MLGKDSTLLNLLVKDKALALVALFSLLAVGSCMGYVYAGYSSVYPMYAKYIRASAQLNWYKWCAKSTYENNERMSVVHYTLDSEEHHICMNLENGTYTEYPSKLFKKPTSLGNSGA